MPFIFFLVLLVSPTLCFSAPGPSSFAYPSTVMSFRYYLGIPPSISRADVSAGGNVYMQTPLFPSKDYGQVIALGANFSFSSSLVAPSSILCLECASSVSYTLIDDNTVWVDTIGIMTSDLSTVIHAAPGLPLAVSSANDFFVEQTFCDATNTVGCPASPSSHLFHPA